MDMTAIRVQNEHLQRNLHQFMRAIRALSDEQFTQSMDGWSPRDVVAHLIGWNRASIGIADAIRKGETPQILVDPGEDFSKVNAAFVREYASTDMVEMLRELELSYQELARHLYTLDPQDWTREVPVPGWKNPTSVQENIHAIALDYEEHRQAIERWAQTSTAE